MVLEIKFCMIQKDVILLFSLHESLVTPNQQAGAILKTMFFFSIIGSNFYT
jgi:hypothetical protein